MKLINLKNEIKKNHLQEHKARLKSIESIETKEEIFECWQHYELLTKLRQQQIKNNKLSLPDAKFLMIKKQTKNYERKLKKEIDQIEEIENLQDDFESAVINVEWAKGSMATNQASAEVNIKNKSITNSFEFFYGGKTTGFGYDKESTTVSRALNQCKSLLKLLYQYKNKSITICNRDLFGYGSGYGTLPYFEGGVGISCYYEIFKKIGFKMKHVARGKKFDVYIVEKIKRNEG